VIAPGKRADLLLLRTNPLQGLRSAFEGLELVVKAGEIVVASDLSDIPLRPLRPSAPLT